MATTHQRQVIREAAAAVLKGTAESRPTAAGERVIPDQLWPFKRSDLPAIAIYDLSESADDQQSAPRELKRTLALTIEGVVGVVTGAHASMDALALQIEKALARDPTLGDTASDLVLKSTIKELANDADREYGVIRLEYEVVYYTGAPDADDVTLDDLRTTVVQTSLGGTQAEADRATDYIGEAP